MEEKKLADANISFKCTRDFRDDLQKVSELTGRTMTDIIVTSVNREIAQYRNKNGYGKVQPIPAHRLTGLSEYEKRVAEIEGRQAAEGKHGCLVLDDTTINPRQPHYKIYDRESKQIMTVPKDCIAFDNETDKET
ncbi:MAG: hypothetical protein K6G24_12220 [Lachnospiraceae bacterium]|nr:hypothetical protein [Lachnospiraceae bacterium]